VHLHTQRQRTESNQSQNSIDTDQYQDALENQPQSLGTPTDSLPLSLSMAGALASSIVNHQVLPDPPTVDGESEGETSSNEITEGEVEAKESLDSEVNTEPVLVISDIEESETHLETENVDTVGTEIRDNTQADSQTGTSQDTAQDTLDSQDTTQDITDQNSQDNQIKGTCVHMYMYMYFLYFDLKGIFTITLGYLKII